MSETTVIEAGQRHNLAHFFLEIWRYRDLLISFVERDVKLRYKQAALGVTWVVMQPVLTAGIFSTIFGRVVHMPSDNLPHGLFYISSLVPWIMFSAGLTQAAASLEGHSNLINKIYFPRAVVPLAAILVTVPDFLIGFTVVTLALSRPSGPPRRPRRCACSGAPTRRRRAPWARSAPGPSGSSGPSPGRGAR